MQILQSCIFFCKCFSVSLQKGFPIPLDIQDLHQLLQSALSLLQGGHLRPEGFDRNIAFSFAPLLASIRFATTFTRCPFTCTWFALICATFSLTIGVVCIDFHKCSCPLTRILSPVFHIVSFDLYVVFLDLVGFHCRCVISVNAYTVFIGFHMVVVGCYIVSISVYKALLDCQHVFIDQGCRGPSQGIHVCLLPSFS